MRSGLKSVALTGLLLGAALAGAPAAMAASGFTNFELGAAYRGQTCPDPNPAAERLCVNNAAEPAIRADNGGNFYGSSENGLGGGTDAWKSPTAFDGHRYTFLGEPDAGSTSNNTGFAPGGGDTDLAVAPVRNAGGQYNVYVASLSLANVDVSTSTDGGQTFTLNPVSATIPGDDREWIAADGASKVCISYHDTATSNIDVNCSYDAGTTFTQLGDAIDAAHLYLLQNNEIGNQTIDPASHIIYQTFSGIANAGEAVCATDSMCNYHVVYMAVSTDGGQTFTDHVVYANPDPTVGYGHQFVNVSVDRAGNVYSVYSDNHNTYYSFSTDHGTSWHGPYQINTGSARTAIMPWSVAGDAGRLAVVYYGSPYYDGATPPDNYPPSAQWYAFYAENDHALQPRPAGSPGGFTQRQATDVIHTGGVCESGVTCTGNRDLYDDFGVAVSPVTNTASIIYSDDQYDRSPLNPPPPGCNSPADNSQPQCDHTNVATGSSRLFQIRTRGSGGTPGAGPGHGREGHGDGRQGHGDGGQRHGDGDGD